VIGGGCPRPPELDASLNRRYFAGGAPCLAWRSSARKLQIVEGLTTRDHCRLPHVCSVPSSPTCRAQKRLNSPESTMHRTGALRTSAAAVCTVTLLQCGARTVLWYWTREVAVVIGRPGGELGNKQTLLTECLASLLRRAFTSPQQIEHIRTASPAVLRPSTADANDICALSMC